MKHNLKLLLLAIIILVGVVACGIINNHNKANKYETEHTVEKKIEKKNAEKPKEKVQQVKKSEEKKHAEINNDSSNHATSSSDSSVDSSNNQGVDSTNVDNSKSNEGVSIESESEPSIEAPKNDTQGTNKVKTEEVVGNGNTIPVTASHYTADCVEGCSGITATGIDVRNTTTYNGMAIIATDPSVIPTGSKVRVDTPYGSFNAIAADRGGGIVGNTIDILVGSHGEAIQKGRVNGTVTILN